MDALDLTFLAQFNSISPQEFHVKFNATLLIVQKILLVLISAFARHRHHIGDIHMGGDCAKIVQRVSDVTSNRRNDRGYDPGKTERVSVGLALGYKTRTDKSAAPPAE